jgi:hypothetical protein
MPTRPDLRDLAANVREAFADADRETLLDVLTFVVKEYVVEGPPPMLIHQVENLADLAGLTFAQLVTALQTRLDHAELGLFAVDGEQVSVRIGGVMHPLMPSRTAPTAAELPRPSAGVRVVETNVARAPAPVPAQPAAPRPQTPTAQGAAPPPRGISMRGRPSGAGADVPDTGEAPPAAPPAGAPAPPASAAPQPGEKPEGGSGDDASARFSLLELD